MPAFVEDIKNYIGTGELNSKGESLLEFLDGYNPNKYANPCVTSDVIVLRYKKGFRSVQNGLKILLVQRRNHPYIGYWAVPGGFCEIREDLMDCAKRELEEETGISGLNIDQLYTWGDYKRDPRTRVITTTFLSLVEEELALKANDDVKNALWFDIIFELRGEAAEIVENKKRINRLYNLKLQNEKQNLNLEASVSVSENKDGPLKERNFKILSSKSIAFDHPKFIVQALLHLQDMI